MHGLRFLIHSTGDGAWEATLFRPLYERGMSPSRMSFTMPLKPVGSAAGYNFLVHWTPHVTKAYAKLIPWISYFSQDHCSLHNLIVAILVYDGG
jgi:hypothetical protein